MAGGVLLAEVEEVDAVVVSKTVDVASVVVAVKAVCAKTRSPSRVTGASSSDALTLASRSFKPSASSAA